MYEIYTSATVKRRRDGTFKKNGGHEFLGQQSTIEGARKEIEDTSHYIKYTGDELKNFVPGRIPVDNFKKIRASQLYVNLGPKHLHMRR